MTKCLDCGSDVAQKEGKRPKLFCNGNCRNKYYYKKKAANKPKKKVGRPKKDAAPKDKDWALNFAKIAYKEQSAPAFDGKKMNRYLGDEIGQMPPLDQKQETQLQIDKLTAEMNGIAEGNVGTILRNKLQDKITKLKRNLK